MENIIIFLLAIIFKNEIIQFFSEILKEQRKVQKLNELDKQRRLNNIRKTRKFQKNNKPSTSKQ